jgi:hypothetical protein
LGTFSSKEEAIEVMIAAEHEYDKTLGQIKKELRRRTAK